MAPLVQALVLPHAGLMATLAALTELGAGGILLLSTLEVSRRRFAGRLGTEHGYERAVALRSSAAALTLAGLSATIYLLQGGGLPVLGTAPAFDSPTAIELFVAPVALGIAWLEFGRFRAPRTSRQSAAPRAARTLLSCF